MLTHPTLDMLHDLGLHGMAKGFKEIEQATEARALEHAEWLALLLEHEATLRRQKRFEARARTARLRHNASVEDIDYHAARGLDRALFLKLAACDFIRERHNLLITGPCGVGKSWLAWTKSKNKKNILSTGRNVRKLADFRSEHGRLQIGTGFNLECMAGFVGIRTSDPRRSR
jgi:DNA replication protein DnaC